MNRFLRKLLVGAITLILLTTIGTPVFAADDCGCGDVVHVTGPEQHKILADLMKTDVFKEKRIELLKAGYRLEGLNKSIDVEKNANGEILIAIPLLDPRGKQVFLLSFRGMFIVTPPMN